MTTDDRKRLQAEHDAISKRLETASPTHREELERQFGERLAHLRARLVPDPLE
jgi:hypothetical protein